jgi:hypothetical protein
VPYHDCEGFCVDLDVDHLNCGGCGIVCEAGEICQAGACVASCREPLTRCSGVCYDLSSDPERCGTCTNACEEGEHCIDGECGMACYGDFTECMGVCVDLSSDWNNCGMCRNRCADGEICADGACELRCAAPLVVCGEGCTDLAHDPFNCGSCGSVCFFREACVDGSCVETGASFGHAILIGHDYQSSNSDMDAIIGNAVLLANTGGTINVLGYTQYSDLTGEVANVNAAVTTRAASLGRTVVFDTLDDYTLLDSTLPGHDVLLIYEMESGGSASTIGPAWATTLDTFVRGGGVVIACNYLDDSWQVMNRAGLIGVSGRLSTGTSMVVVEEATNPLMYGVTTPYSGLTGTSGFMTSEPGIVARMASGSYAVVIHKIYY